MHRRATNVSMAARRATPYSLLEYPEYVVQMKAGRPSIKLPTRQVLSRDVRKTLKYGRQKLAKKFRVSLHVRPNSWSSHTSTEEQKRDIFDDGHMDKRGPGSHLRSGCPLRGEWSADEPAAGRLRGTRGNVANLLLSGSHRNAGSHGRVLCTSGEKMPCGPRNQ